MANEHKSWQERMEEGLHDLRRRMDEGRQKLGEKLGPDPLGDMSRNVNSFFESSMSSMGLVRREEFDKITQQLAEAQQRIVALEERLQSLEKTNAAR